MGKKLLKEVMLRFLPSCKCTCCSIVCKRSLSSLFSAFRPFVSLCFMWKKKASISKPNLSVSCGKKEASISKPIVLCYSLYMRKRLKIHISVHFSMCKKMLKILDQTLIYFHHFNHTRRIANNRKQQNQKEERTQTITGQ